LDVDWSTKGVGVVLCPKDGRKGVVVPYESKGLSKSQKKYHPMEGECYPLIWVVMHFKQYLHHVDFILHIDHKPVRSPWQEGMLGEVYQDHPHGKRQTYILTL
jgi:hypothetical protein